MMRAVILSDTHGNLQRAELGVRHFGDIHYLLHAGDHWQDGIMLAELCEVPCKVTRGNCDFEGVPDQILLQWSGLRILLLHGHRQRVKEGIEHLAAVARRQSVDLVVYGHTHLHLLERVGSIVVINPGSPTLPRNKQGTPTIGCLECDDNGNYYIKIVSVFDGSIVKEMHFKKPSRIS